MKSDKQHEYHPKETVCVQRYTASGNFPSVHTFVVRFKWFLVIFVGLLLLPFHEWCCSAHNTHKSSRAAYTTVKRVHIFDWSQTIRSLINFAAATNFYVSNGTDDVWCRFKFIHMRWCQRPNCMRYCITRPITRRSILFETTHNIYVRVTFDINKKTKFPAFVPYPLPTTPPPSSQLTSGSNFRCVQTVNTHNDCVCVCRFGCETRQS